MKKKTTAKKAPTNEEVITPAEGKEEKKVERQLLKIIGFCIFLVLLFFLVRSWYATQNIVEYKDLTFVKERISGIEAYRYNYFFDGADGGIVYYNLYVRNNPAENDVQVIGDPIVFQRGHFVYVSLNKSGLQACPQSVLAVGDLGRFLSGNQLTVRAATLEEAEAEQTDLQYITCENKPNRVVVEIREGEETKIEIDGKCHRITVANCEILQSTEKYIVESIVDARTSTPVQETGSTPLLIE